MENNSENANSTHKKKTVKSVQTSIIIVIVLLILLVLISAGTAFFMVDETEQAVLTRFGKYYDTVGSGLHFKLPFGIDKNYNVPTRVVQTEQFGFLTVKSGMQNQYKNNISSEATMLTGDLNIVDVEWIIQYRIVDPRAWLFSVLDKQKTIRDISQSVINTLVGDRAILTVMGSERSSIEVKALEMMNENFRSFNLGIQIIAVKLQNIVPPSGVQAAFEDVNKSIQDMNRYINEGREAYNKEIPRAQGEAEQQVLIAQGYATERINKALGDVARFNAVYEEYRKAPTITRDRLYLEAMETIFNAKKGGTLVDKNLEGFLPIKDLTSSGAVKK